MARRVVRRVRSSLRILRSDQRGIAMVSVSLLATALLLSSALLVLRANNEYETGKNDRDWERAAFVAEAGVDDFLYDASFGGAPLEVPDSTPLATKTEIVDFADQLIEAEPWLLTPAPEGEAIVFKTQSGNVAYSVGFTPSWDDPRRKVRVIKTQYEFFTNPPLITNWEADFALLSGGDINMSGAAEVTGAGAHVHANGSLYADYADIEGCGTETLTSGYDGGPVCPVSPVSPVSVPLVDPMKVYHLSWFDMCEDGYAHYGPAYPDPTKANATSIPCDAAVVSPTDGANQGMSPTSDGWANNDKNTPAGVYFVIGDFDGRVGFENQLEVTVITAKPDFSLDCTSSGANMWLTSQTSTVGHPSAGGLTLVSAGDIVFRGGAEVTGLVLAHEQIDYKGSSSLTGAVIAEDSCDTTGLVISTTDVSGTADIIWVGPIGTPFDGYIPTGPGPIGVQIVGQWEI